MIAAIMQSNPSLAKSQSNGLAYIKTTNGFPIANGEPKSLQQKQSDNSLTLTHSLEGPFDMSGLSFEDGINSPRSAEPVDEEDPYMFIPPYPRAYYRTVLKEVLTYTQQGGEASGEAGPSQTQAGVFFTKATSDLLAEIGMRWRVPLVSRLVLFLDCARQDYLESSLGLDEVDGAFAFFKESLQQQNTENSDGQIDRSRWPVADWILNQRILTEMNDNLLRDLFAELLKCYDTVPNIELLMAVLGGHIWDDPIFSRKSEDDAMFAQQLQAALRERAQEKYKGVLREKLAHAGEDAEFFHVLQFSQALVKLMERIRKRYRRTPDIMG